jgi:hypothetical protein
MMCRMLATACASNASIIRSAATSCACSVRSTTPLGRLSRRRCRSFRKAVATLHVLNSAACASIKAHRSLESSQTVICLLISTLRFDGPFVFYPQLSRRYPPASPPLIPPALPSPVPFISLSLSPSPGYLCCMSCVFCMEGRPIPFMLPMSQFCCCVCTNCLMSCPIRCICSICSCSIWAAW